MAFGMLKNYSDKMVDNLEGGRKNKIVKIFILFFIIAISCLVLNYHSDTYILEFFPNSYKSIFSQDLKQGNLIPPSLSTNDSNISWKKSSRPENYLTSKVSYLFVSL